mmetsp:Transcript_3742/g.8377  ORF Transcript_3742/g.8377 Transcript_3742/m.8377 type:complete len:518 (-) Transcript_3742:169-1722(-)
MCQETPTMTETPSQQQTQQQTQQQQDGSDGEDYGVSATCLYDPSADVPRLEDEIRDYIHQGVKASCDVHPRLVDLWASRQDPCRVQQMAWDGSAAAEIAAQVDSGELVLVMKLGKREITYDSRELPSPGSFSHIDGSCKRCCFYPKGRCTNDSTCEFCHFPHPPRRRRVKKKEMAAALAAAQAEAAAAEAARLAEMEQYAQMAHMTQVAQMHQVQQMCMVPLPEMYTPATVQMPRPPLTAAMPEAALPTAALPAAALPTAAVPTAALPTAAVNMVQQNTFLHFKDSDSDDEGEGTPNFAKSWPTAMHTVSSTPVAPTDLRSLQIVPEISTPVSPKTPAQSENGTHSMGLEKQLDAAAVEVVQVAPSYSPESSARDATSPAGRTVLGAWGANVPRVKNTFIHMSEDETDVEEAFNRSWPTAACREMAPSALLTDAEYLTMVSKGLTPFPSVGSSEHFSGTCSRCCNFRDGSCRNGGACRYCHLPHEASPAPSTQIAPKPQVSSAEEDEFVDAVSDLED